jgi:hypothetical protein
MKTADEIVTIEAPAEKPKKKKPPGKEPTEWLRTTPMGRQEIIDECVGLPDQYIQAPDGKGKDGKPTKGAGKRRPSHEKPLSSRGGQHPGVPGIWAN